VPFTVTVNTTAASAVPPVLWRIPPTRVPVWPFALLFFVLLVFAKSLLRRRTPLLWAAALFFVSLSLLASCSGKNSTVSNPGTPLGTSTLTLTGTSGSVSQNLSLTLTVQ
jgi:hypothetical protein